uniref:Uncharacterized protein n=1 Tax=Ditylenchus dipsaci TaxID=166011 RepID=A0A915DUN2_9BILA
MQLAYLPYLSLVQHFINLVCQLITAVLFSHLIYSVKFKSKNLRIKELSFSMQIYLYTHIVGSLLSCGYQTYMIAAWRVPSSDLDAVYNPYAIYWLGIWQVNYLAVSSVPVVFLSVDRILAVKNVEEKTRHTILKLPLCFHNCENSACLMVQFRYLPQIFSKIVFGSLNLILSGFLFYMTKEINSSSTRVIKFMVTMEILFSDIPTFGGYIFNITTGKSAANYFGEFTFMFSVVESSLCAIFYTMNMYRRRTEPSFLTPVRLTLRKQATLP